MCSIWKIMKPSEGFTARVTVNRCVRTYYMCESDRTIRREFLSVANTSAAVAATISTDVQ